MDLALIQKSTDDDCEKDLKQLLAQTESLTYDRQEGEQDVHVIKLPSCSAYQDAWASYKSILSRASEELRDHLCGSRCLSSKWQVAW